ncbi:L-threonylcarbamoyladenylate synthase [Polymorphobacter sp.]|uniref:L-threonylcarbamoyladenylate synthase n=1 Tax=Polymorphobacter sp. TaxID=1909290 RepID=UPI003F7274E0
MNQGQTGKDVAQALADAAAALRAGGIVAVPTETVYGLAGRADSAAAVAAIYAAKGRPATNPLIVHVIGLAQAETLAVFDAPARALAAAFWPGPLTLVLPVRPDAALAAAVTGGQPTIAVRAPDHPLMQALIAAAGPLAAPSANRSGHVSPTTAAHVRASLGAATPLVVDGGPCTAGLESTIVATGTTPRLLRPGALAAAAIEAIIGPLAGAPSAIVAPGMMESHYAPRQPLRLNAITPAPDEYMIGFGPVPGDTSLSPAGNLAEAAAALYAALHLAEASDRPRIAIAPVPNEGLGRAINDRLRRASAGR